jgi:acyl carrier protein
LSIAGVELAAVIPQEIESGNSRLTAFVKPALGAVTEGRELFEQTLRHQLEERMPGYAVPSTIRVMESIPLTGSGKVDRAALGRELASPASGPASPVMAGTGSTLREIWAESLGHDDFGVEDSFFGVGGNSINAVRLINRVEERFGKRLQLRDVFDYPTIAEMAARLDRPEAPGVSR